MKKMYVDRELKFITLEEWGKLFEDFSYRLIARTPIGNIIINTVWTGVNLPFGTPFETAIFQDNKMVDDQRHCTEEQAKDYHLLMVMGYISQGFLNYLQEEALCIQSPAPTAEQISCEQPLTPKCPNCAIIA
jgi:hypothetical protein